jgi:hypothetical protein
MVRSSSGAPGDERTSMSPCREVLGLRVDEHHADHFVRMLGLEQPDVDAAHGVRDKHVGSGDGRSLEERLELVRHLAKRMMLRRGARAVAVAPSVVRARACDPTEIVEHQLPARAVGAVPVFEDHRGRPAADAVEVQRRAATDVDHAVIGRCGRV